MKVYFDTSVLVAAVVDQLEQHEKAFELFAEYCSGRVDGYISTQTVAECYDTLVSLPLKRRIQPLEAQKLIEENFEKNLKVLNLTPTNYSQAIERASNQGLKSGTIYNALHVIAAEKEGCERLYTFAPKDFVLLKQQGMDIVTP